MSRGDRKEAVFPEKSDNDLFLDTLDEACGRTGWHIHAYVLMRNHFHLLLETPEPNLVAGMQWLQGTYTARFNARHKVGGHLFQGRYKALPVENSRIYFPVVSDYIHLNPARAGLLDPDRRELAEYNWSSYPLYMRPSQRPDWLRVDRTLDGMGLADDRNGRSEYRAYMRKRVDEVVSKIEKGDAEKEWQGIRKGWAFGSEDFRERIEALFESNLEGNKRSSYAGEMAAKHDEREADRLLGLALDKLGLTRDDLTSLKKGDGRKKAIAWVIKTNTTVKNEWLSRKLHMGSASNIARLANEADDKLKSQLKQIL